MTENLFETKNSCCGCSACYAVCPVNAITMAEDAEGFRYPEIDQTRCINCRKCQTVCPLKADNQQQSPLQVFAAKNTDEAIRQNSSSGGVFSLLAAYVESEKGVIYGAAFDEDFAVRHMRAETVEEWKAFCVSKYVQSDINDVFRQVREDLKAERPVLFSGTPCQVDGLKAYLQATKTDACRLVTCDIVCHGTPSPKVWKDYIAYLQKSTKAKISAVSFRNKEKAGWRGSTIMVRDANGNVLLMENQRENFYFQLFSCSYILRPACHACRYANFSRPGDITLGDFWGIEKNFPEFDDDKGISLVLINSDAGKRIWESVQSRTECFEVTRQQCLQPNLQSPTPENPERNYFWHWYSRYGIKRAGQLMGFYPRNHIEKVQWLMIRCWDKLRRMIQK